MKKLNNPNLTIVAYVQPTWEASPFFKAGQMVLSTWSGKAQSVWLKLDTETMPPMAEIGLHVVEAYLLEDDENPPPQRGWLQAVAFVEKPSHATPVRNRAQAGHGGNDAKKT